MNRIKGFGSCSVFIQPEFHFLSCRFVDCVVFAEVHFPYRVNCDKLIIAFNPDE